MKISRIIIKKFRSIDKADIWISSINAIVGQNNAGKSCLLRAMNAFFNFEKEEAAFEEKIHSYAPRTTSKIEMHFEDFDINRVQEKYINNNKIIVEVSVTLNATGCNRQVRYKGSNGWVSDENALHEVKKQIEFILIPPNRDAAALEKVENSVLQMLVEEKMKEATE